jgi:cardiolipin synthase A/B
MAPPASRERKQAGISLAAEYSVADREFRQSISHLLGPALTEGNRITTLVNGDEIFPAMLDAIRKAEKTVTFENYIWSSGKVSTQFIEALIDRSRAGVKVHMIVDGFGGRRMKKADIAALERGGVEFVEFNHPHWWNLFRWLNHRTHRKLLIVDGKVAFTGGVSIADEWIGNAEAPPLWRDTHYRLEGPVVAQMQGVFMDNWIESRQQVLQGDGYFPPLAQAGPSTAHFFKSGPRNGMEPARLVHLHSIASARKNIRLAHAYFIPDDHAIDLLVKARERGVVVEVVVPGKNDSAVGRAAARWQWRRLMDAGVRFYLYEPALYHCKLMIVDDLWVTAGSVNFDDRSFRINDEANFNVLDPEFAAGQVEMFEVDKSNSRLYPAEEYKGRSCLQKFLDCLASTLRPLL